MPAIRAIHQILPTVAFGDAIGNHVLALQRLLRSWGYASDIFAQHWDPRFNAQCRLFTEYRHSSRASNLLIYHYSIGGAVNDFVASLPDQVVLYYHNITPSHFFYPYNRDLASLVETARRDLQAWASRSPAIAGSDFNRRELLVLGFRVLGVVPYTLTLHHLDEALATLDPRGRHHVFAKQDNIDWLYVGRLSPNKCIHDLIEAFHYYQTRIVPTARLLLVGTGQGLERYVATLYEWVTRLKLDGKVAFVGPVESPAPFYAMADIFVTFSEHEGFCVPLLEAMHMNLPVLAYASTAIPETLGSAGILFRRKDFPTIAEMAHEIIQNEALRKRIVFGQRARLAQFTPEFTHMQLRACLEVVGWR